MIMKYPLYTKLVPRRFLDILSCLDLKQHVQGPTQESGHTLDLVISRHDDSLIHHVRAGDMLADHNAIFCSLNISKPGNIVKSITTRKWKTIDTSKFNDDLHNTLSTLETSDEPSELYDSYCTALQDTLDSHAPSSAKTITVRP